MHVHELHQLSQLIVEIGDCFMVRRTLARLESGELTLREAIVLLKSVGTADPTEPRIFYRWPFLGSMARNARGFMHVCAEYANGCLWPKADIRTESKWVFLNGCFGEKSGHSGRSVLPLSSLP